MAVSVKDKIMEKIGFSQDVDFYNGLAAIDDYRVDAARKLHRVIQQAADEGVEIAPPDRSLTDLLVSIAANPDSDHSYEKDALGMHYHLDNTHKAAADIIQTHIDAFGVEDQKKVFEEGYRDVFERFYEPTIAMSVINRSGIVRLTRDSIGNVVLDNRQGKVNPNRCSLRDAIRDCSETWYPIDPPDEELLGDFEKILPNLDLEDRAYAADVVVRAHIRAHMEESPELKREAFEQALLSSEEEHCIEPDCNVNTLG